MRTSFRGLLPLASLLSTILLPLTLTAQDSLRVSKLAELPYGWDHASGVVVSGDHAFIADGISGLRIIDISDPTQPTETGVFPTPGQATDIVVNGTLAFVGGDEVGGQIRVSRNNTNDIPGFFIVDISDLAAPRELAFWDSSKGYKGIVTYEHYVIMLRYAYGNDNNDLFIIDVEDPTAPRFVTGLDLTRTPAFGAISGRTFFVTNDGGIDAIDITNPEQPDILASLTRAGYHYRLAVSQQRIFVRRANDGITVYDFDEQEGFMQQVSYQIDDQYVRGIAVDGTLLYLGLDDSNGNGWSLQILDFNDLMNITSIFHESTTSEYSDIALNGNHAFIAADREGLIIRDIDQPEDPDVVGTFCNAGFVRKVHLQNNYLYTAHGESGWGVFDVRNPAEITETAFITDQYASDLAVMDGLIYVGGTTQIYSLENPALPLPLAPPKRYEQDASINLLLENDLLIQSTGRSQAYFNVSVPLRPAYIGTISENVEVGCSMGNSLVNIVQYQGLKVYDFTRPAAPKLLAIYETEWEYRDVKVRDSVAFIACAAPDESSLTGGALQVVDLSNPNWPVEVGFLQLPAAARVIKLTGNYALIGCNQEGIRIIDIRNFDDLQEVGFYNTPGYVLDIAFDEGILYLADSTAIGVYDASEALGQGRRALRSIPQEHIALSAFPNPANAMVFVNFEMSNDRASRLLAFDPLGRLLEDLTPKAQGKGHRRTAAWDVNNLPAGRYMLMLESGGTSEVVPVSVVK